MATERRLHRTPLTVTSKALLDSNGDIVAVFNSPEMAAFVARACNRYDNLMGAFDLCRGHMDGLTIQPHTAPSLKAFSALADTLIDDIQRNGR